MQRAILIVLILFLQCCYAFRRSVPLNRQSRSKGGGRYSINREVIDDANTKKDVYYSFSPFDKLLFDRFASSVASEMGRVESPRDYRGLMDAINEMTQLNPSPVVHDQGKSILTRLFPDWLLKQYQWMFAAPFPAFSAWMNAWVTHW
jgi:hypothetical protein